ncbi:hypothetical protein K491DRAFT_200454 [Lophiostoma macrostomum CBS 122681]|uniref:Uncharacterized protein n=1 Tax=Lophiostoma macrostomum CBS 122681 TaxID=1314788 RepID=A0A6A6STC3_9PLEO|nr:hypothetical protein K491DRAFT_200454 [Lophiostoma macrostomum CBS 122681]
MPVSAMRMDLPAPTDPPARIQPPPLSSPPPEREGRVLSSGSDVRFSVHSQPDDVHAPDATKARARCQSHPYPQDDQQLCQFQSLNFCGHAPHNFGTGCEQHCIDPRNFHLDHTSSPSRSRVTSQELTQPSCGLTPKRLRSRLRDHEHDELGQCFLALEALPVVNSDRNHDAKGEVRVRQT